MSYSVKPIQNSWQHAITTATKCVRKYYVSGDSESAYSEVPVYYGTPPSVSIFTDWPGTKYKVESATFDGLGHPSRTHAWTLTVIGTTTLEGSVSVGSGDSKLKYVDRRMGYEEMTPTAEWIGARKLSADEESSILQDATSVDAGNTGTDIVYAESGAWVYVRDEKTVYNCPFVKRTDNDDTPIMIKHIGFPLVVHVYYLTFYSASVLDIDFRRQITVASSRTFWPIVRDTPLMNGEWMRYSRNFAQEIDTNGITTVYKYTDVYKRCPRELGSDIIWNPDRYSTGGRFGP